MRKEVILAVIIGVILGGIILYGLNLANNSASKLIGDSETQEKDSNPPTPTPANNTDILFITPQDHAVITEDKTILKGSTKPNVNIAIITESDDILTVADKNGGFTANINLINGENTITVTTVDSGMATSSASITVIRTTSLPE
ncbi:MAG TPA: hypothetical protein PLI45_00525 [Candidatus Woesebacteria bacterium]|nr:hypothetical protein [Candidatus Woesebacteria bacterium]